MNDHLPSADPDRTNLREPSAEPGTIDATADATDPRLVGWMGELRDMMGTDASVDATNPRLTDAPAGSPAVSGYRITGEIAKGGMGRVYAAIDLTLDREVAIKTLLPGANADRFVTESKITAKLPHPNIPPVYELGHLADGTPFLAMKLVRGQTLSALLKARPSPSHDLPRWVQVFEGICQAVGFAHSRGVIHRDLKPLNVMVGEFGEVQVMDWGLARLVASGGREAADSTPANQGADAPRSPDGDLTRAGAIMGTPGYMAPEQARAEPLDARADVFALGATLAAILTGKPAFVGGSVAETIQKAAVADLTDVTSRLDSCGADADLIAVAKRCLSPDREARPADGRTLADEVRAYRAGVEARLKQAETDRAEAVVRATETRKRQRVMTWAGAITAAVLLAGVVGTTTGMVEAQRQTGVAKEKEGIAKGETAAKDKALGEKSVALEAESKALGEKIEALAAKTQALQEAETNLGYANKGNQILGSVFEALDPKAKYYEISDLRNALRDNLQNAAKELDGSAIGDPLVVARMQNRLGLSLLGLGEAEQAITLFEKARKTFTAKLGPDHPDTLTSTNNLAVGYQAAGQLDRAVPQLEETLELRKAKLGPDHPDTLQSMGNLAGGYQAAGRLDKAVPLLEETLELRKAKLGPDHLHTLASMNNLAGGYKAAGRLDKAVPLYEVSLELLKTKLGPDHPSILTIMNNLAAGYLATGRLDKAVPLFEAALKLTKAKLGPDHPHTLTSMGNLAGGYRAAKKLDKAVPLYEETFKLWKGKLGPDHPDTLISMNNLADGYRATGRLDKAVPLLEKTLELTKAKLGPDHPSTLNCMGNLGKAYCDTKQGEKAAATLTAFVAGRKKKYPPSHPPFAGLLSQVSLDLLKCDQFATAEEMLRESLAIREKAQPDAWATFNTQSMLGWALLGQKKHADAEPLLVKGYEGMKEREKDIPKAGETRIPEALDRLVELYTATEKPDEVKKYQELRAKYPAKK